MSLQIKKIIGSGFLTGYIPFAPGTFGSLFALGIYFIPFFQNTYVLFGASLICFLIGLPLGNYFEKIYGKDPKQFTLDEFVGTWIALMYIPDSVLMISLTFIIWRVLDIVKPYPANKVESLKGGLGIMSDDVVAGMYSLIIIYIFKVLFL